MALEEKKKKILIVAAVFPPEPVVSAKMAFDVAVELSKEHEVIVLSPHPSRPLGNHFTTVDRNYPFRHVILDSFVCPQSDPFGRMRESLSFGEATLLYLRENKESIGVIYADTWPMFAQKRLCKEAKKLNIPLLMHIQDVYPDSFSKKLPGIAGKLFQAIFLPLDKFILRNSTDIIGISPSMIQYLSKSRQVSSRKFLLVRNWQNDSIFLEKYKPISSTIGSRHFMFLGSVNPTASVETIIRAFAKSGMLNAKLSIIGTGPDLLHCRSLAESLHIDVNFSYVDAEKVPEIQSGADVLLLPLKTGISYTATPSKLTAYLFSGRPVIAAMEQDSDAGHIITDSGCGIVVPSEDVDLMADAMKTLNAKPDSELNNLGEKGLSYAKKHLSRDYNRNLIIQKILSYGHV